MDSHSNTSVIRVAIQRPIYKLLDYECDIDLIPEVGFRIRVPLGNTVVTAIVVETSVETEFKKLKSVIEVLDQRPLFDQAMFKLLQWASQYYFYPLGEVLFHALPVALRKGKQLPRVVLWKTSKYGYESLEDLGRAPKQREMLELLRESENSSQQLQEVFGSSWRSILRQLDKKKLIVQREESASYVPVKTISPIPIKNSHKLTKEQNDCVHKLAEYFVEEQPKPVLLHGITGSGKTEVYLRSIESTLENKKQALVLVPEIGLTPQLLLRFKEHFPNCNIALLHSALTNTERLQVWLGASSGSVDVVIGTRSAVFTPMKALGVIIVDEEHDSSLKQQEGFLYHGRDMAIKRAYDTGVPILLGSATPSLESLYNVEHQGYRYLRLGNRPGKSKPPEIAVQDIRSLQLDAGISKLMIEEMRRHLEQKNQVMLFLNRRGFAPVLMCPECGWHGICQHCDVGMTYHAAVSKLVCHHCGVEQVVKSTCPDCSRNSLTTLGQGTERIELVLNTYFPNTPTVRIDRDSISKKGSLEKKLEMVHSGVPVILIGTQMLAKGHDFPNLTLVGILDIDQALFSMDFRAQEKLAQQILQVAGRAGRGERRGRVILQTSQPEHPMLLNLLSQGYYKTSKDILKDRKTWKYPPYGVQALIRVSANSSEAGISFLSLLRGRLDSMINASTSILGPMESPLFKKAGRFRFQLLLATENRGEMHAVLILVLRLLIESRKLGGVRWSIDVDPLDFL